MNTSTVPIWEKYNLTIKEAAEYFNIGRDQLYKLTKTPDAPYVLRIGRTTLIKRKQFEDFLRNTEKIS